MHVLRVAGPTIGSSCTAHGSPIGSMHCMQSYALLCMHSCLTPSPYPSLLLVCVPLHEVKS
eukprot:gene4947-3548_t